MAFIWLTEFNICTVLFSSYDQLMLLSLILLQVTIEFLHCSIARGESFFLIFLLGKAC